MNDPSRMPAKEGLLIVVIIVIAALGILGIFSGLLQGQIPNTNHSGILGDIEWMLSPLVMPCDPGGGNPARSMFPCPPVEAQGVMIMLRSPDDTFAAFDITVHYIGLDGAEHAYRKAVLRSSGVNTQGGGPAWSGGSFEIGRLSVPHLPHGTKVQRVRIEKLVGAGNAQEVRIE